MDQHLLELDSRSLVWVLRNTRQTKGGGGNLPVTVMPNPCVAAILGAEVRLAVVVDLGGEA